MLQMTNMIQAQEVEAIMVAEALGKHMQEAAVRLSFLDIQVAMQ